MNTTPASMPRMDSAADQWMPSVAYCPVSLGTRLMGDRWSLLIVRELLVGTNRFNAIHRRLPGISRTLLASRLRYLAGIGVIEPRAEGQPGARAEYTLTAAGIALRPVLEALGTWTTHWQVPSVDPSRLNAEAVLWHLYRGLDRGAMPSQDLTIGFSFSPRRSTTGWIYVSKTESGACMGFPERETDMTVFLEPDVFGDLWWGERTCAEAIKAGDVGFEGPRDLVSCYPTWFRRPHMAAS